MRITAIWLRDPKHPWFGGIKQKLGEILWSGNAAELPLKRGWEQHHAAYSQHLDEQGRVIADSLML